jgi:hypothetical protein
MLNVIQCSAAAFARLTLARVAFSVAVLLSFRAGAEPWGVWALCLVNGVETWKLASVVEGDALADVAGPVIKREGEFVYLVPIGDTGLTRSAGLGSLSPFLGFSSQVYGVAGWPLVVLSTSQPAAGAPYPGGVNSSAVFATVTDMQSMMSGWGLRSGGMGTFLQNGGLGGYASTGVIPIFPSAWAGGGTTSTQSPLPLDTDGDGDPDSSDPFPNDATKHTGDLNGDGIEDSTQADTDGDGDPDATDPDPNDPLVTSDDTDGDGINDADEESPGVGALNNQWFDVHRMEPGDVIDYSHGFMRWEQTDKAAQIVAHTDQVNQSDLLKALHDDVDLTRGQSEAQMLWLGQKPEGWDTAYYRMPAMGYDGNYFGRVLDSDSSLSADTAGMLSGSALTDAMANTTSALFWDIDLSFFYAGWSVVHVPLTGPWIDEIRVPFRSFCVFVVSVGWVVSTGRLVLGGSSVGGA